MIQKEDEVLWKKKEEIGEICRKFLLFFLEKRGN